MGDGVLTFASEMIKAFGEDRFYHAMMRLGSFSEGRSIFEALGGKNWDYRAVQLGLRIGSSESRIHPMGDDHFNEVLCRTAFVISSNHKEFALKKPTMPPSIHARMLLGAQNEWTRKYIEAIKED